MADVSQNVKRLESVLIEMGYDLTGHKSGEMDESFKAAFKGALDDLLVIGIGKDAGEYDSSKGKKILEKAQQNRADVTKMAFLNQYTDPKFLLHKKVENDLIEEGFSEQLRTPKNVKGVINFFKNAETYMADINAVSPELNPAATVQVKTEEKTNQQEAAKNTDENTSPPPVADGPAIPVEDKNVIKTSTTDASPSSSAQTSEAQGNSDEKVIVATKVAKEFLVIAGRATNDALDKQRSESPDMGVLMEIEDIPTITTADGTFDRKSQEALQALLKTMASRLDLEGDEEWNYTPAVGEKILKRETRLRKGLSEAQNKQLDEAGGLQTVVGALNTLHAEGQLGNERLYDGQPVQLTGMGAQILSWVFGFIKQVFPPATQFVEGALKNFTGGYGYEDLMPKAKQDPQLIERLGVGLSKHEQLVKGYKEMMAGLKQEPGETKEDARARLKGNLDTTVSAMMALPAGDDASHEKYKETFDKAWLEAGKIDDPDKAAQVFASVFEDKNNWDSAQQLDPSGVGPRIVADRKPQFDPATEKNLDGSKKLIDQRTVKDIKALYDRQISMNDGYEKPLFFKDTAGKTYVAGWGAANLFTVQEISPNDAAFLSSSIAGTPEERKTAAKALAGAHGPFDVMFSGRYQMKPESYQASIENAKTLAEIDTDFHNKAAGAKVEGSQYVPDTEDTSQPQPQQGQPHSGYQSFAPIQHDRTTGKFSRERNVNPGDNPLNPTGALVYRNQQVSELAHQRYTAMSRPVILGDDLANRGVIRVLIVDDKNGLMAEKGRTGDKNFDRTLVQGEQYFRTVDITSEYRQFEAGFRSFVESNPHLQGKSDVEKMKDYIHHYEYDSGGRRSFEQDYPGMASIIRDPSYAQGGVHYGQFYTPLRGGGSVADVPGLYLYLSGQMNNVPGYGAQTDMRGGGWFKDFKQGFSDFFNGNSSGESENYAPVIQNPGVNSSPIQENSGGGVYSEPQSAVTQPLPPPPPLSTPQPLDRGMTGESTVTPPTPVPTQPRINQITENSSSIGNSNPDGTPCDDTGRKFSAARNLPRQTR
ncbi:MAG: hypothetical protein WBK77_07065 [Alphaproteobacteria bacterium]